MDLPEFLGWHTDKANGLAVLSLAGMNNQGRKRNLAEKPGKAGTKPDIYQEES